MDSISIILCLPGLQPHILTQVQIGYHLQSYTSQDAAPFHGAIMESGGATARATLSPSHPRTEEQFAEFLRAAGIEPTQTRADQIFPLLRSLPLETILYASSTVFSRYQDPIRWPFQPVIESPGAQDGAVTDLPINHFRRGSHLKIPVLAGFNTNEGTVFASPRVDTGDEFLGKFATMIPGLSGADLSALAKLYPDPVTNPTSPYANVPPGFGRQWARYEAAYSHYAYVCPVLQTGHFHSDHEESDGGGDDYPVWIVSSIQIYPCRFCVALVLFSALVRSGQAPRTNQTALSPL